MRTLFLLLFTFGSISFFSFRSLLLAQSQPFDPAASGRHFVLAFPDIGEGAENLMRSTDNPEFTPSLYIYLYSAVPNTATISSPGGGVRNIELIEGMFQQINALEINGGITERSGEVIGAGITIRAEFPIVVYCYMETTSGADMWTPIAVENWGLEYSGFTFPGQVLIEAKRESRGYVTGSLPVSAPAGIMVVAAYNDTRVTINSPVRLAGDASTSVLLNAGEVYQVQSIVDTSAEKRTERQQSLQGTRITATRPIGVLSGNTRFIPLDDIRSASDNTIKNLFYEWLTPNNMLGSEFVYTPTWDSRRQLGGQQEDYSKKRAGESLFICGTAPGTTEGTYHDFFTDGDAHFSVNRGDLHKQYMAGQARPGYLRTSKPAQVFVAPSPVSISTELDGLVIGAEYETYGSYVAELTPVEQWPSFAPFTPPTTAKTVEHFLNVVTRKEWEDSIVLRTQGGAEQSFLFNRGDIPGTEYIWGTMSVIAGKGYYLRGLGTARFSGTCYGFASGAEAHGIASFNPEYVVYTQSPGIAYGYTLSPRRNVNAPPDSIVLETSGSCVSLNVNARIASPNPAGIRSVELAPGAINAHIRFLDPVNGEVSGSVSVEFIVEPVNPDSNASATVVITDRTSAKTELPYAYTAKNFIVTNPWHGALLEFVVSTGVDSLGYSIRAANQGEDTVVVWGVKLTDGSQFSIAKFLPPLPATLAPGQAVEVIVVYPYADSAAEHRDTLVLTYGCGQTRTVPLHAKTEVPCVNLEDLNFGTLEPGISRTLPLTIMNSGKGHIVFYNDGNNPVLGLGGGFSTDPAPFAGSDYYRLPQGYAITIDVTFTATDTGTFRRVLRFASSWHGCRDSAILTARVLPKTDTGTSGLTGTTIPQTSGSLLQVAPNPFSGSTAITVNLPRREPVRLEITDPTGATRAVLLEETLEPGRYALQWNPADLPSGIYFARLSIGKQSTTTSRVVFVR